jgi:uncharacterized membrane protein YuzA (DUF378 family)
VDKVKGAKAAALLLIIVGGLNWLLVGLFQWDLVGGLFGRMDSVVARIIYVLVGLAAIYALTFFSVENRRAV